MVEKLEGEHIETVRSSPGVEYVTGEHGIEVQAAYLDPQLAKCEHVELRVVCDFRHRGILQKIAQRCHLAGCDRREVADGRLATGKRACRDRVGLDTRCRHASFLSSRRFGSRYAFR